jgi:large subunit ribosomal protein L9
MKVILIQDVKDFGKKGEVKEVAEGYARNFLFPKKLVEIATEAAVRGVEMKRQKEREMEIQMLEEAKKVAEKIKGRSITIKAKDKKGKLFGSILAKDIVAELGKEDIQVEERWVKLENPIKKIGNYSVKIVPEKNIEVKLSLIVKGDS